MPVHYPSVIRVPTAPPSGTIVPGNLYWRVDNQNLLIGVSSSSARTLITGSGIMARVPLWTSEAELSSDAALTYSGGILSSTKLSAESGILLKAVSSLSLTPGYGTVYFNSSDEALHLVNTAGDNPIGSGSSSGHVIQDAGTPLTTRAALNFIGFTVTDNPGNSSTDVNVPTGLSYTDENAQDAVGAIFVDTATIDFTYNDAVPSITASIKPSSIGPTELASTSVTPGSYTLANITVDVDGRITAAASGSPTTYSDEAAQDAVGGILVDTATVHLVYSDATPSIMASVQPGSIGSTELSSTTVVPGPYTFASITVDADGRLTAAATGFVDEPAQDAVGNILADSTTIDFTYDDSIPSITAEVVDGSITNTHLEDMAQATIKGRADGAGTGVPTDLTAAQVVAIINSTIDHGALAGLGDDDHTQYARLLGRVGGQSFSGGTAATNDLDIDSTTHATKGIITLDPTGNGQTVVGGVLLVSGLLQAHGDIAGSANPGGDLTIDSTSHPGKGDLILQPGGGLLNLSGAATTALATAGFSGAGAGSDLDADLLDGEHGSFYQDATNLTTGTLPFARIQVSAASTLLGRGDSGSGDMEEITLGAGLVMTGTTLSSTGGSSYTDEEAQDAIGTILVDSSTIDFTYADATPSITAVVIDDSITYAKIQNISAASRLLGRGGSSGAGDTQEISLGSNLSMSGTTLNASTDADTLDGLDSTQFLRSDVTTTFTGGQLIIDSGSQFHIDGLLEMGLGSNIDAASVSSFSLPSSGIAGAGSGSGLDADLLDGLDSTQFLRSDTNTTYTGGTLSVDSGGILEISAGAFNVTHSGTVNLTDAGSITLPGSGFTGAGSGSDLDADKLDGLDSTDFVLSSAANEIAQDAVGTILTDSSTIDFTYNDATPSITAIVIDDSITYAKIQNISAASKLLGRGSASGSGDTQEITLGTNLSMSGTTLNATAGGGSAHVIQDNATPLTAEPNLNFVGFTVADNPGNTSTDVTFPANPTVTSLTVSGLTASRAVFTDGSKVLVSVAVTGTGDVVRATSPTLVTPVLGAASGTSLNLSGLTASQAVFTDGSKNLVSVATTGSGSAVLATSPTLVTPTLGAASGTSLNLSGLTASQAVFTDGSKNLASVAVIGTGSVVLSSVAARKYVHTQGSSSASWSVAHNLATNDFSLTIYDASTPLNVVSPDSVTLTDTNNIVLTFAVAFTGKAVVTG